MIQTILCIWWTLLILSIGGTCWAGWEAWKAGNETENYDFYGLVVVTMAGIAFSFLAAATICAIKLAGGGW